MGLERCFDCRSHNRRANTVCRLSPPLYKDVRIGLDSGRQRAYLPALSRHRVADFGKLFSINPNTVPGHTTKNQLPCARAPLTDSLTLGNSRAARKFPE